MQRMLQSWRAEQSRAEQSRAEHGLVTVFFRIKLYTMMDNRRIDETDMSC
ncbi:hypothetical protein SAMN02910358_01515 [Lachnospiraceae bacterium XBB1006]|nr:hypothetical protein SAMN02910358_01515 [Lachnospiraceae bacterium XBB1006]